MVKLLIGGDICATKRDESAFVQGDATSLFSDILPIINEADLAIANLETPLINSHSPISKSGAVFGNKPEMLNAVKKAGINFLNLANNHILDHGEKGLKSTLNAVNAEGFYHVGAGENIDKASEPFSIQIKGKTIAIMSYAEHEFSTAENKKAGANPLDLIDFVNRINTVKVSSDFVLLLYHGGKENYMLPSPNQQKLCRFFVDQGVDLVVCQHSHIAGAFENYNSGHIYYGQGNYIFDPYPLKREWLYKGILIEVVIKDDSSSKIEIIPYVHKSLHDDNGIGIQKMNTQESQKFIENIQKESEKMISNVNFVTDQWNQLAHSLEPTYLSILNGNGRVMRKLNEKFPWLKMIYKKDRKLVLKNIVTCETHHEILKTILKEK